MDTRYQLTLTLSIADVTALWGAAAALAMDSPYMTMDDVIETLGPIDAPQIEDCLTMLIQPERFGGCQVEGLEIAAAAAAPIPAAAGGAGSADEMRGRVEARRERFAFQTSQTMPAGEHARTNASA